MAGKAGEADKLGNTYEALWTWNVVIDLLNGKYESIEFEPQSESSTGIEFIVWDSNGIKHYHSTKINSSASWKPSKLSKISANNPHAVLHDLFNIYKADPTSKTFFITTVSTDGLVELEKRAKKLQDPILFKKSNISNSESAIFNKLLVNLNIQPLELILFLAQFQYMVIDERWLADDLSAKVKKCVVKMNADNFELYELFGIFWKIREESFGKKLSRKDILAELNKQGYKFADWSLRLDIREKIADWNRNFSKLHGSYNRILESAIPRKEADELFQLIKEANHQIVCLTGVPGSGKSEILVQFQRKLDEEKIPLIALSFKDGAKEYELLRSELKENPENVLSGIAKERKSVFILDGIDSIGKLSGNHTEDWIVFFNLLDRIVTHRNNITIVLGCRKFDFENDESILRIRSQYKTKENQCKPLPLDSVNKCLAKYAISQILSEKQKDLLRTPIFLKMYLEGDTHIQGEYSTPEDVFFQYWESINKRLSERFVSLDSILDNVIKGLIASRQYRFDRSQISNLTSIELLLKEGLLLEVGNQLTFFHPILQDYAVGRYFVRNRMNIKKYLKKQGYDEKLNFGLKVRSILAIHRRENGLKSAYFSELKNCFFDQSIPLFVKVHVLDWFGNLKNPNSSEWDFIYNHLSTKYWEFIDPKQEKNIYEKSLFWLKQLYIKLEFFRNRLLSLEKRKLVLRLINRIPFEADSWFALAEKKGYWARLKEANTIQETINFAKYIRSSNFSILKSNILSEYVRIWNSQSGKKEAILFLIEFAKLESSIDLQETILFLIDDGFFDTYGGIGKFHFLFSDSLSERFRIELLARVVGRALDQENKENKTIFTPDFDKKYFPSIYEFKRVLMNEHLFYAEKFFPIFLTLLEKAETDVDTGLEVDSIWPYYFINDDPIYVKDLFLQNLIRSFIQLAINNPDELKRTIGENYLSLSQTMVYLLFNSLSQNPSYFFEILYEMIQLNPNVLLVGDVGAMSLQSGNHHLLPPRKVIQGIFPFLREEDRNKLVQIIMNLPLKADQYYLLLVLLNEIPEEFRSNQIIQKVAELKRRYEQFDTNSPVLGSSFASFVGPPIEDSALEKMNDRQWIHAMKKYDSTYKAQTRDFLKGDGRQLSQAMQNKAEKDPSRFVKLLLNTNEKIESFYFSHVLLGISKVWKGKVDLDLVLRLIEKSHLLPGHPCLREISSIISDLAEENLPDSILEIIKFYAEIGKDPFDRMPEEDKIPDYLQIGINSDRGSIAWTIGKLISKDEKRYIFFKQTIAALAEDPKAPVRACTMIPIYNILNYDRNEAVELYLNMLKGHFDLSGMQISQQFLQYAIHSHYPLLRETLIQMTKSDKENIQKIGSSIITYSSFENKNALEDFRNLKRKISSIRRGIVEVVSQTIESEEYRDRSLKILSEFFGDEDDDIQFKISHSVENFPDDSFVKNEEWLENFIKNHTFRIEYSGFLKRILKLPKISDKLVLLIGREAFNAYLLKLIWNIYYDSDLIDVLIRGYHQTTSLKYKPKLFQFLDCSALLNQRHIINRLEINDGWKEVA
ncbi:hypothetical protein CH372_19035 [Leptospira meyeri]|uniref:ATP-binding protein n=1 Tax=Leptospira meyeri TaxID=29508 RepID=UPI000C2AFB3D|nr:ATP-binding protein [Leptospira meyeri]PKA10507.1 hypothetical protein CH372_19035 [Leptospira meyeri]